MKQNDHRSALNPPDHIVARRSDWLKNGEYTGSLQEMDQAYLESKGYDNWSDYVLYLGFDGHFNEQKRKFWAFFSKTYLVRATLIQRVVHYFTTTQFGIWYIQKDLGMKGRTAA